MKITVTVNLADDTETEFEMVHEEFGMDQVFTECAKKYPTWTSMVYVISRGPQAV